MPELHDQNRDLPFVTGQAWEGNGRSRVVPQEFCGELGEKIEHCSSLELSFFSCFTLSQSHGFILQFLIICHLAQDFLWVKILVPWTQMFLTIWSSVLTQVSQNQQRLKEMTSVPKESLTPREFISRLVNMGRHFFPSIGWSHLFFTVVYRFGIFGKEISSQIIK